MLRRHTHPADHIHFASGLAGWLRWTAYWITSRTTNAVRALRSTWGEHLRPALTERRRALADRARTAFGQTTHQPEPSLYASLADAVRGRGFSNARA